MNRSIYTDKSVTDEFDANESLDANPRRTFLTRVAGVGLGVAAVGLTGSRNAAAQIVSPSSGRVPQQPEAETGKSYPMAKPNAKSEKDFRLGVAGPAMLSLVTSQIAVDKATDADAKKFANFELREAIAVTTVLKETNTPVPPMDANAQAILAKIKSTPQGEAFDKIYMTAQLGSHEFLRDLAESYLTNSAGAKSMPEMHGRHLAMLSLATFKEHVVHSKDILSKLS